MARFRLLMLVFMAFSIVALVRYSDGCGWQPPRPDSRYHGGRRDVTQRDTNSKHLELRGICLDLLEAAFGAGKYDSDTAAEACHVFAFVWLDEQKDPGHLRNMSDSEKQAYKEQIKGAYTILTRLLKEE